MELDNWYFMFYDKFDENSNINNPKTCKISLNDLFNGNYKDIYNQEAIEIFNKSCLVINKIPELDFDFYKVIIFTNDNFKSRYNVCGINIPLLKNYIENKKEINNIKFLLELFRINSLYQKVQENGNIGFYDLKEHIITNQKNVKNLIMSKTGDITDKMITQPDLLNINLYDYQKRTINWMFERENNQKIIRYTLLNEVSLGEVVYFPLKKEFGLIDEQKAIIFNGGALIDEVGLGKTIQMITLSLMNKSNNKDDNKDFRLFSKATLIICPTQLCGQWKREIENKIKISGENNIKVVQLLTKPHFDKVTYQDLLEADFVLISYAFLDNKNFIDTWLPHVTKIKNYHKNNNFIKDRNILVKELENISEKIKKTKYLNTTNCILPIIKWHRIIVDEFHEISTIPKYIYIKNILSILDGKYKWCVTGTPFNQESTCLLDMVNFVSNYTNNYEDRIFTNNNIIKFLENNFFRRNTKKSVESEYTLPPIKESIIWLKFTPTERLMYNAYLANNCNDKYSPFLRKLCCHPKLAEEIKDDLAGCNTLEDIEKKMISFYKKAMLEAQENMVIQQNKIKLIEYKLNKYILKRQKWLLSKKYKVILTKPEKPNIDEKYIIKYFKNDDDINLEELFGNSDSDSDSDNDDDKNNKKKPLINVSINNIQDNIKKIGKAWEEGTLTLSNKEDYLKKANENLKILTNIYNGKKTTWEFYNNLLERIRKTVNKAKKSNKDSDSDNDSSDSDEEEEEPCSICLDNIPEAGIGVTKCGHMFCHECIMEVTKKNPKCPYCQKTVLPNEIMHISYENPNNIKETKENNGKLKLINKIGTKLANLVYYIKNTKEHIIIFSQWNDLLEHVGAVLNEYDIKNIFCRGNVWQRDKAIRTFNEDNNMRVIMLSSESAASGTNLTKASKVILIDPVYGNYEFRKNTEWQAIGRAHRMGQTKQVEVVRFIIKNTIEEEIYNENKTEDAKYINNKVIFEMNEEEIILNESEEKEIENTVNKSKKRVTKLDKQKIRKKKEYNSDNYESD
jgi:SNF2 family DNA or RNA helicase